MPRFVPLSAATESKAGFTLVEALVAFVIAAAFLGLLLQSFSGSLAGQQVSGGYATAVLLAESKLAETGALLAPGQEAATGLAAGRYAWQVTRYPYLPEENGFQAASLVPYELAVRVTWTDGGEERSLELNTLRLEQRPD